MNFRSIRVLYPIIFSGISIIFIIFTLSNFSLIAKTEDSLIKFGESFNPAISAVLNADRDLYQARVAELQAVSDSNSNLAGFKADFDENAQQAYDRMKKYQRLMQGYPAALSKLRDFESSFQNWRRTANQVFNLVESGQLEQAQALSTGQSIQTFNKLRDFYDAAGEATDNISEQMSKNTIESVASSQTVLIIFGIIVVGLTMVTGYMGPKTTSDALEDLSEKLRGLNSGDGDLTRRINSDRHDEVGQVAHDLDELIEGLAALIRSILEQSQEVITGVSELDTGASKIQQTSQQQTDKVDAIVTAVNEMSYAIKDMAENANLTSTEVDEVNRLTQEGSQITQATVVEMEKLSDTVTNASDVISKLAENSSDIASVLDVIRGIAEQTNLLALNAAIEAARAGEQGRGFAVVADEVRTLASRTQESTQSIQEMIEALQTGVEQAVNSISKGSEATATTVSMSQQTLDALQNIAIACSKVGDVAAQTATATEEQSQVAQDISQNLTLLSDHTKANYEVARNNGNQANTTMGMATELSNSVSRFKLD